MVFGEETTAKFKQLNKAFFRSRNYDKTALMERNTVCQTFQLSWVALKPVL